MKNEIENQTLGDDPIERESHETPPIPVGWNFLVHGGNTVKDTWDEQNPFDSDTLVLKRSLSTVTQAAAEADGFTTAGSYSTVTRLPSMSEEEFNRRNRQFEIRVIFYAPPRVISDDLQVFQEANKYPDDSELVKTIHRYYVSNDQNGRHPFVPRGTTLVKVGSTNAGGREAFYFVPEDVLFDYLEAAHLHNERLDAIASAYPAKRLAQLEAQNERAKGLELERAQWDLSITDSEKEAVGAWNVQFQARCDEWQMDVRMGRQYMNWVRNYENMLSIEDAPKSFGNKRLSTEEIGRLFEEIHKDGLFYYASVYRGNRILPGVVSPETLLSRTKE